MCERKKLGDDQRVNLFKAIAWIIAGDGDKGDDDRTERKRLDDRLMVKINYCKKNQ